MVLHGDKTEPARGDLDWAAVKQAAQSVAHLTTEPTGGIAGGSSDPGSVATGNDGSSLDGRAVAEVCLLRPTSSGGLGAEEDNVDQYESLRIGPCGAVLCCATHSHVTHALRLALPGLIPLGAAYTRMRMAKAVADQVWDVHVCKCVCIYVHVGSRSLSFRACVIFEVPFVILWFCFDLVYQPSSSLNHLQTLRRLKF